ncbi:MAG: glycerophosphodiester phosphodiesterase family protein [Nitratireductor sp.]
MKTLNWLRDIPITHRGLHDASAGKIENSVSAIKASIENGFSIEVDLQLSKDRIPIVFHDFTLDRLTSESGSLRKLNAEEICQIELTNSQDKIANLSDVLKIVDGKVGLVLELKGVEGDDEGYVQSVIDHLKDYGGNVVLMSFDHWLIKDALEINERPAIGYVSEGDDAHYDKHQAFINEHAVDFISYNVKDLPCAFTTEFKKSDKPIICWTVSSEELMRHAYIYADQITFEQFNPNLISKS